MAVTVTSVKEFLGTIVPAKMLASPDKFRVGASLLLRLSGPDGGTWSVNLPSFGTPSCVAGAVGKPSVTVDVAASDFLGILKNPMSAVQMYLSGKLKASGNMMEVTKLTVLTKALE